MTPMFGIKFCRNANRSSAWKVGLLAAEVALPCDLNMSSGLGEITKLCESPGALQWQTCLKVIQPDL